MNKTLLAAAALSTLTLQAHAFGPFGTMIQNQIQSSVQNAVGSATDAAINAGVNAAVNGAVNGAVANGADANTANAAATAATSVNPAQVKAMGALVTADGVTGGAKAAVIGQNALGALFSARQQQAADMQATATANTAAMTATGTTYTIQKGKTSENMASMGNAYRNGVIACGQDQACIACLSSEYADLNSGTVTKANGTHTLGASCTTTAAVAPAAGN